MQIVAEEWRPLAGQFAGWPYEISNSGRLRVSRTGLLRKPHTNRYGYIQQTIAWGEKRAHTYVHRLVAMAFVPGYSPGLLVNHINGIKTDNRPENLEWVTYSENHLHAFRTGIRGQEQAQRQVIKDLITPGLLNRFMVCT